MTLNEGLKILRRFFQKQRRMPTYQEMSELFGFSSKRSAFKLVEKLVKAGFLEKDDLGRVTIKRIFPPLPVLGVINAGYPQEAEEQLLDTTTFDEYLVDHPESSFLLKVSGDSMIDAGICPGDHVIVEKGKRAREGDIVVAYIDNEWTLKYFQKKDGKVCLVAANKKYPVFYPKNNMTIEGIVISVIRKYHRG